MNKKEVAIPEIVIAFLGGLFGKRPDWCTGGLRENLGKGTRILRHTHLVSPYP
jgi:hypothetical protein